MARAAAAAEAWNAKNNRGGGSGGGGAILRAVLWYQGETDAMDEALAASYQVGGVV